MKHQSFSPKHKDLCTALNAGLVALFLLAGNVHAADAKAEKSQELTSGGIVGVGVATVPAYLGSDQQRNQAIIPVDYRWSNGVFMDGKGLGFNASSNASFQFGPLLNEAVKKPVFRARHFG